MKHIFVRPAKSEDADNVIEWSKNNPAWDPEVGKFASTYVFCAYDEEGPIGYAPVQQPQMLESIAFRPELNNMRKALILKEFIQALVTQAHIKGSGEIYFLGSDPATNEFARENGFEEIPWTAFRLKLKDLETVK